MGHRELGRFAVAAMIFANARMFGASLRTHDEADAEYVWQTGAAWWRPGAGP
jgi:hypothetical protein